MRGKVRPGLLQRKGVQGQVTAAGLGSTGGSHSCGGVGRTQMLRQAIQSQLGTHAFQLTLQVLEMWCCYFKAIEVYYYKHLRGLVGDAAALQSTPLMRPMWVGSLSPQNCGKEICFNLTDTVKLKTNHISPFTWAYRELRAKCGA